MTDELARIKRYQDAFPTLQRQPGMQNVARSTLLDMGADFGYEAYMAEWEDGTIHAAVLPRPGSNKRQKILLELLGDTWYIDELRIAEPGRRLWPGEAKPTVKTFPKHDRPKPDMQFTDVFLRPLRVLFNDGVRVARKEGTDIVVEIEGQRPHQHKGPGLVIER